ncbi:hypothetical protein ACA910_010609 [Epithemia clementina (nom. ined.)]
MAGNDVVDESSNGNSSDDASAHSSASNNKGNSDNKNEKSINGIKVKTKTNSYGGVYRVGVAFDLSEKRRIIEIYERMVKERALAVEAEPDEQKKKKIPKITTRVLAREAGCSKSTAGKIVNEFEFHERVLPKAPKVRKYRGIGALTFKEVDKACLSAMIPAHPTWSLRQLFDQLIAETGCKACRTTVYKWIQDRRKSLGIPTTANKMGTKNASNRKLAGIKRARTTRIKDSATATDADTLPDNTSRSRSAVSHAATRTNLPAATQTATDAELNSKHHSTGQNSPICAAAADAGRSAVSHTAAGTNLPTGTRTATEAELDSRHHSTGQNSPICAAAADAGAEAESTHSDPLLNHDDFDFDDDDSSNAMVLNEDWSMLNEQELLKKLQEHGVIRAISSSPRPQHDHHQRLPCQQVQWEGTDAFVSLARMFACPPHNSI